MATVELTTLGDKLEQDELKALLAAYKSTGAGPLDIDEVAEQAVLDNGIDDDVFVDFFDKLEANDAAADIYLPTDFEEVFSSGDLRVGSAHALLLVLENLREEFHAEEDKDEDEDDDDEEEDDEIDPFVADDDEDGFFDDDDEADEPIGGASEDDSKVGFKEEQLRHIWRLMAQGARAAIRRGLVLFVG